MVGRREERLNKLWCRLFGHRLVDGLRYRNSSTSGCSKICQRCGFYEVVLDDPHAHSIAEANQAPFVDTK